MSILTDLTSNSLQRKLEENSVFFKSGTVAILYFDNLCHEESIISLCIWFCVQFPIFCAKKSHQTLSSPELHFPIQPYTGSVYLYKCIKDDEGGVFVFLMDIAVGGGLRLI